MTGQDTELYLLRTMLDNRVSDKLSAVESLSMLLRQYSELYNTITKLARIDNILGENDVKELDKSIADVYS